MAKTILFVTVVAAVAGCGQKDENKAGGAAKSADPAKADTAAKPAAAGKTTCDSILPKSIRDKYFAGWKIENIDFPVAHAGKCRLTPPDGTDIELGAACKDFMKNSKGASYDSLKAQFPDMQDVAAGEAMLARQISPEIPLVQFTGYTKGAFCQVDGMLPKSVDLTTFLNDWLPTLPTS